MSRTKRVHGRATVLRHQCSDCKGTASSRMDCKNLEKLMCLYCPKRDHYMGDCDITMRNGNPSLSKTPGPRRKVAIEAYAWESYCDYGLYLLRSCGFKEHADTLLTQHPSPQGIREPWEGQSEVLRDPQAKVYDSFCRLTRLKRHLSALKRYSLKILEKIEEERLAEAAMDPLVRWQIDPKSQAIEKFGKKLLFKIPTTIPATSSSIKTFVERMHRDIKTLTGMPGETLYWRYTIAMKLVYTAVRWKMDDVDDEPEISLVGSDNEENGKLNSFVLLDKQFLEILQTGMIKKESLPYDRTLCILETHRVTDFYPVSWRWLKDYAVRYENGTALAHRKGEENGEAREGVLKRRKLNQQTRVMR